MMITVLDKKAEGGPKHVKMHAVDAQHALAADPKRYEEVGRDVVARKSGSLEGRLTAIEDRLDRLESASRRAEPQPDEVVDE